jgi:hypothetical protein
MKSKWRGRRKRRKQYSMKKSKRRKRKKNQKLSFKQMIGSSPQRKYKIDK